MHCGGGVQAIEGAVWGVGEVQEYVRGEGGRNKK